MKTQKERLQEYMQTNKISQNGIERILGLSTGTITHTSSDLSDNIIGKIVKCIPELNIQWILSGDGSMYSDSQEDNTEKAPQTPIDKESLLIETLRDQIEMQKKYISVLEERIATLKKEKTFADVSTAHTA